jgi:hypothetical protein
LQEATHAEPCGKCPFQDYRRLILPDAERHTDGMRQRSRSASAETRQMRRRSHGPAANGHAVASTATSTRTRPRQFPLCHSVADRDACRPLKRAILKHGEGLGVQGRSDPPVGRNGLAQRPSRVVNGRPQCLAPTAALSDLPLTATNQSPRRAWLQFATRHVGRHGGSPAISIGFGFDCNPDPDPAPTPTPKYAYAYATPPWPSLIPLPGPIATLVHRR